MIATRKIKISANAAAYWKTQPDHLLEAMFTLTTCDQTAAEIDAELQRRDNATYEAKEVAA